MLKIVWVFASPLHRLRWEEACFGTLPLSNFIRNRGDDVLHHGMGYKMTRSGGFVLRWVKRYFVLVWSILYVFDGNKGMDRCRGAVYMYRAEVKKTEVICRPAIVIAPATQKRLSELGKEKFASFTMTVEAPKLLDIWNNALRKTSAVGVLSDSVRAGGLVASLSPLAEKGPQQPLLPFCVNKAPVNLQEQETVTYVDVQIPNVDSSAEKHKEQLEQDEGIQLSSPSRQEQQENSEKEFNVEKARQTIIEDYRRQLQCITVSASLVKKRLSRVAKKKR
ncbi:hypothetical protein LSM04_001114 [Trypanosoma melophagium]|uniref:uncharacterized protein n=1 Tax=Trypanosoma melophagium TaxID=715481 RepID=UPI00351A6F7A|nr:hypothetical protein LSM04_001114 [Trypanosoma melophagium]